MRIVSSNLQHGVPDPVGPPALGRAVAPLAQLRADVYGLQELDHWRLRTRWRNQGRALARQLGGRLALSRAKHWLWAAQANALIVRGDIISHERVVLRGPGERRVVGIAAVRLGDERWSVANTHLSLDPEVATQQLADCLRSLGRLPAPRVLVGDLNLRPDRVAGLAADSGYALLEGDDTINARTGLNRRLDHVLVQDATVADSGVAKLPVSDHLAVWADVVSGP